MSALERLAALVAFLLPLATACAGDEPAVDELADSPTTAVVAKQGGTVDLISSTTCTQGNGRLRQCRLEPRTVSAIPVEYAVPVRTVVRRVASGNCSTQFPLAVSLSAPELIETRTLAYLTEPSLLLRAPRGAPIAQVMVSDASSWTRTATFEASCNIRLQIELNEPDIDTAEQAQAALAAIDLALTDARHDRENYQQLLLFHGGHVFLRAVADSLHQELSNDMMQRLREAYAASAEAFGRLDGSSACHQELGGSIDQILDVADALFILGDPADWTNPDGTRKTLADMYSEFRGGGVIAQIEELARTSDPSLEQRYRDLYDDAALVVAQLEAKRLRAVHELEPWLRGTP